MTIVKNALINEAGQPVSNAFVKISLLAPTDTSGAWASDFSAQIIDSKTVRSAEDGTWSLDLIPNSGITPENSVYQVVQHIPGTETEEPVSYIIVPDDDDEHFLGTLLTAAPDDLPIAAALISFDPEDSGMESTNVEDAILEAFLNGHGSSGPSIVQTNLGGVDGVVTQGTGSVILDSSALTVIYSNFATSDPALEAGFLVTVVASLQFADGTAGEAGEKIFFDIAAAFSQIPELEGKFALLHGANWQGRITEREGTTGIIVTGLPHTFQDWFGDSLGQAITDPLTGGDFILLVTSTFGGPTP